MLDPTLATWDEFTLLKSQGHVINISEEMSSYDVIVGPQCWQMYSLLRQYLLSHTLPEARLRADQRKKGTLLDAPTEDATSPPDTP